MGRSARPGLVELLSMLTVLCCHIYRDAAGDCVIYVAYYATSISRTAIFKQMVPGRFFVPDGRDLRPGSPSERVGWWILAGVEVAGSGQSWASWPGVQRRVADSGRLGRVRAGDMRRDGRTNCLRSRTTCAVRVG